jgi:hypothetical protein
MTFRKLDLSPPSGGGGETPTLFGPLERANLNHWSSDFHTLQITSVHTMSFPAGIVYPRRFLAMASNNGYSFASGPKSSLKGDFIPTANSCSK